MDSLAAPGMANADFSKLSDRDKQELQQFAMNESQKARIQSCMCGYKNQLYKELFTDMVCSYPLSHRYLLPQMHFGRHSQERQTR